jgi:hypothetical protein
VPKSCQLSAALMSAAGAHCNITGICLAGAISGPAEMKYAMRQHRRVPALRPCFFLKEGADRNAPLEGGLRIPAIARWPGRIPAGAVSEQVMISMDWMPTLLAAAGTQMDPAYPPDGENLLPVLTAGVPPHPRKLFWRFKGGGQRGVRDGDWKYLLIAGNDFLFDVVKDPRGRANLKDRYKNVFDGLKNDWDSWNATMLPERSRPALYNNPGNALADHYGVTNPPPPAAAR